MKSILVLILILLGEFKVFAAEIIWPELSFAAGSEQIVGDPGSQNKAGYELGINFWGPALLEPNARSGFFAIEFGGYSFDNKGSRFLGSQQTLHNSTTTLMPYARLFGSEDSGYFLIGVGFRLNSLSFETAGKESRQTFGSYVYAMEYLHRFNEKMRLGAKWNWSSIEQTFNDHNSFIETTGLMAVLTYQP